MKLIDLVFLIPEVFVSFWLISLFIQFAIVTKRKIVFTIKNQPRYFVINPIPCITAILLLLAISYFAPQIHGYKTYYSLAGLYSTPVVYYVRLILSFLFILYIIYLRTNMQNLVFYSFEFYIVLFFAFISLNFILISSNFLNLFIFIEIYSLCVYYLIASKKNTVRSIEAAIKYFIFGSFSSVLLLFGIFLVYYSTGCGDIFDISRLTFQNSFYSSHIFYNVGAYLICLSIVIKIGASVFYFWIVEIYDGTSFNMLIFLNLFPKLIYLLVLFNLINKFNLWHLILLVKLLILSSLIIGLFGALNEIKIKRFLVYTSIYNITFFSIPFWIPNSTFIGTLIFFSSVYLLNFFVSMILFASLRNLRTNTVIKSLIDLNDLKAQNPRLATLFIFFSIFASGLPLTAIFLAKFAILFEISKLLHLAILFYFLIISGLSFFYYLRLIKVIFQGTDLPNILFEPISFTLSLVYSFTIWFNLIAFLFYDKIILFLNFFLNNV